MGIGSTAAGGFLTGFSNGFSNQRKRRDMLARQAELDDQRNQDRDLAWADLDQRREDSRLRYSEDDGGAYYDPDYDPDSEVSNGPAGGPRPSPQAMYSRDPVNMDLNPVQRAFLNSLSPGESGGKYNVRYTPRGGALFDLSQGQHPRIYENSKNGKSSAAGRYQFVWSTWKGLAGADTPFTPENQDKYAWALAARDYRANTKGRDLEADLRANGVTPQIQAALNSTWTSYGNSSRARSAYADALARYTQPEIPPERNYQTPSRSIPLSMGSGLTQAIQQVFGG